MATGKSDPRVPRDFLYKPETGRYYCTKCDFDTPMKIRAQNHARKKHPFTYRKPAPKWAQAKTNDTEATEA